MVRHISAAAIDAADAAAAAASDASNAAAAAADPRVVAAIAANAGMVAAAAKAAAGDDAAMSPPTNDLHAAMEEHCAHACTVAARVQLMAALSRPISGDHTHVYTLRFTLLAVDIMDKALQRLPPVVYGGTLVAPIFSASADDSGAATMPG